MSEKPNISLRERLSSPLTWHLAGFSVLLIVLIVLGTRFALDWAVIRSGSSDALASKQVELKALEMQTAPLRGLDQRVEHSRELIKAFYDNRIPANYSSFATRIGELEVKSGVRHTRISYSQGKPGPDLTEIFLDANIVGDYGQIMHFINGLERDKVFFVVKQMQLTGQQGGVVNLRLQVSTWMRNAAAAASGLPQADGTAQPAGAQAPASGPAGTAGEGQ
jgi:type IV pilus assembly protein PilO